MIKIETIPQDGYEGVYRCRDKASGLHALIAVHSTRLGPALGGIRMWPYESEEKALQDVLRLAKAMTYKAAACRLPLGGGKAVILGDPEKDKSPAKFQAMAKFIDELKGRYLSAKDSGIVTNDLVEIARHTAYVTGLPESLCGSDDPSPWTARGIRAGLRACVREQLEVPGLKNLKILIQGAGYVGGFLAGLLHEEGARLVIADIHKASAERLAQKYNAEVISPDEVYDYPADIFMPCAMGGILNSETIPRMKFRIIAGGANNQLAEAEDGERLRKAGILYAPDFIVNAGGIINIYYKDVLKKSSCLPGIRRIEPNLLEVFAVSRERGISTQKAAEMSAERILREGIEEI